MLKVEGPANLLAYSGKEVDAVYLGRQAEAGTDSEKKVASLKAAVAEEIKGNPKIAGLTKEIQIEKGKAVYMQTCFVCHQPEGQGLVGQIPPLAKSDFLAKIDNEEKIRGVLAGRTGEVVVNGKTYNGVMIPMNYLSDEEIANVLTYVNNSWGNSGEPVKIQDVTRVRKEVPPPAKSNFE
ncbi:MAG: aniA [Verrucomicrobiales bacterium]|nr:aniA [Verrucomicrobiales bacterium]